MPSPKIKREGRHTTDGKRRRSKQRDSILPTGTGSLFAAAFRAYEYRTGRSLGSEADSLPTYNRRLRAQAFARKAAKARAARKVQKAAK